MCVVVTEQLFSAKEIRTFVQCFFVARCFESTPSPPASGEGARGSLHNGMNRRGFWRVLVQQAGRR